MRRSALALINLMLLTACAASSVPDESQSAPSVSATAPAPSAERDACAEQEVVLVEILAVEPESRAECFGAKSISFRAYVSSMVGVGGYPEQLSPGDGWLDPYLTPRRLLVPVPGEDQRVLAALVPPTMSLDDVLTDRWAIVTGHFADPASDTCGRVEIDGSVAVDADTIEACRSLFVIESVAPGG
jgi:hypothetical protein